MRKVKIAIILILFLSLCGCSGDDSLEETQMNSQEESIVSQPIATDKENEQENGSVRREFCIVEEINDEYMVIKNTRGELYHIDSVLNNDFHAGTEIVLVYSERTEVEENIYEASIEAIYLDNSTLTMPFN